jgi:hypothetical protein
MARSTKPKLSTTTPRDMTRVVCYGEHFFASSWHSNSEYNGLTIAEAEKKLFARGWANYGSTNDEPKYYKPYVTNGPIMRFTLHSSGVNPNN